MGHQKVTRAMRQEIASLIPKIVKKAFRSYETFMVTPPDVEEAKKFTAHYTACKLALSHLEMLIKLLEQLTAHLEKAERESDLALLLERAQKDVDTYKNKEHSHGTDNETE